MPLMKPSHYQGLSYRGTKIKPGDLVDVQPIDVKAHKDEGWREATADEIAAAEDVEASEIIFDELKAPQDGATICDPTEEDQP